MNRLFAIILVCAFGFVSLQTNAQPTQNTNVLGAAAVSSLVGTYRGDYTAPKPWYHVFDLVITSQTGDSVQGTVRFWKTYSSCNEMANITGTLDADGVLRLFGPPINGVTGCDRTFTLRIRDNGVIEGDAVTALGATGVKLVWQHP